LTQCLELEKALRLWVRTAGPKLSSREASSGNKVPVIVTTANLQSNAATIAVQ
jgi:hypothetical protein